METDPEVLKRIAKDIADAMGNTEKALANFHSACIMDHNSPPYSKKQIVRMMDGFRKIREQQIRSAERLPLIIQRMLPRIQ